MLFGKKSGAVMVDLKSNPSSVSIWWLIVPTVFYAYLSRNPFTILVVTLIALGLKWAQSRNEVPDPFKPYLPLLQLIVVYDFLGGKVTVLAIVGLAIAAAVRDYLRLIAAFEPWWRFQERIPRFVRIFLAFALPLLLGYGFGQVAGGQEWTLTFLSMAVGIGIAFLLLFIPPEPLRHKGIPASS